MKVCNEKTSGRSIPGRLPGEMPIHLREHKISLGTVKFDVLLNLLIKKPQADELQQNILGRRALIKI